MPTFFIIIRGKKMKTLSVLGSINADYVISVPYFPKAGETLRGSNYHIAYGGKGANQAVAAARLCDKTQVKVQFFACIGEDNIGEAMKEAFAKDGIDSSAIKSIKNESTGIAMIQVAESGENSIVISAGANAYLDENLIDEFNKDILSSNYLLMQLETPLPAIIKVAKLAKNQGVKVILNPAPAQNLPESLLKNIDIITPNETEAELLTGIAVNNVEDAKKAAEVFHNQGINTVLITLGAKGVYASQNGVGEIIEGFKIQVKDTTAAGDTFNAGFLVALLEGKDFKDAIKFAHAAAAISVSREGAQPSIPNRNEVLEFLKNN